jgi:sugar lactone lactonase YvrE
MQFNDARADGRGVLWTGTITNNVASDGSHYEICGSDGVLYRIDPVGNARVWKQGIGISNTLDWSPDRKQFYFADTSANTMYVYS